jgi:septal ring factor EnvC (AmiA/AmiB activator)
MININFPPEFKIVVEHSGKQLEKITMNIQEAIDQIKAVSVQLGEAKDEILAKIEALESATGDLTEEQQSALDELKTAAQGLSDVVPGP